MAPRFSKRDAATLAPSASSADAAAAGFVTIPGLSAVSTVIICSHASSVTRPDASTPSAQREIAQRSSRLGKVSPSASFTSTEGRTDGVVSIVVAQPSSVSSGGSSTSTDSHSFAFGGSSVSGSTPI
jgi:hypothetical protein